MSAFCSKYPGCGCVGVGTKCYDDWPHLKCEMCGKQDETVKNIGYILCPECDKKLSKSIDACDKARRAYERKYGEFDGGGGA